MYKKNRGPLARGFSLCKPLHITYIKHKGHVALGATWPLNCHYTSCLLSAVDGSAAFPDFRNMLVLQGRFSSVMFRDKLFVAKNITSNCAASVKETAQQRQGQTISKQSHDDLPVIEKWNQYRLCRGGCLCIFALCREEFGS